MVAEIKAECTNGKHYLENDYIWHLLQNISKTFETRKYFLWLYWRGLGN